MDRLETSSADGTRLVVHDLGGDGPVALLVHGAGLSARVFSPLAAALAGRLHCYGLDLRGHGASGVPAGHDFSWSCLADDVAAAAEALGGGLVGIAHSAGGAAALRAKARAPGTFSHLYCYEPVVRTPAMRGEISVEHPLVAQALRRRSRFSSRAEAYERWRERAPFDAITDEALRAYVEFGLLDAGDGGFELVCRPEFEAAIYLAGERSDLFEVAPAIACPVTIAAGDAPSNTLGPRFARVAARRVAGSRLVTFAGLGHLGPIEDPDAVAASISTALATARA